MSAGERIINGGADAVKTGVTWGIKGALWGALGGAALLVGAGLLLNFLPAILLGAGAAIGTAGTATGLGTGGVLALSALAIGGAAIGTGVGWITGGLGAIKGAVTGIAKDQSDNSSLPQSQQLALERQRYITMQEQLEARQRAAAGFNNPDATADHAAKMQAQQRAQESGAAKTL